MMQKIDENNHNLQSAFDAPSKSQEQMTFWLIIGSFGIGVLAMVSGVFALFKHG